MAGLEAASEAVFKKCQGGDAPLFGSEGWPTAAKEKDVLVWFDRIIPALESSAQDFKLTLTSKRKLLAEPRTPLISSRGKRSLDIGFVHYDFTYGAESENDLTKSKNDSRRWRSLGLIRQT